MEVQARELSKLNSTRRLEELEEVTDEEPDDDDDTVALPVYP